MEFGDGGAEGREVGAGVGVAGEGKPGDVAKIMDCESPDRNDGGDQRQITERKKVGVYIKIAL